MFINLIRYDLERKRQMKQENDSQLLYFHKINVYMVFVIREKTYQKPWVIPHQISNLLKQLLRIH